MPEEKTATAEQPKILVRFRASQKSPTLDLMNGEYHRVFNAVDQPFEVKDQEELLLLKNSGFFVEDKAAEKEAADDEAAGEGQSAEGQSVPTADAAGGETTAAPGLRASKRAPGA